MAVILKNDIEKILLRYKRLEDRRKTIYKLARYLLYHLRLEQVCRLLVEHGYRCTPRQEPWHVEKARQLYWEFVATQNIGLLSKAQSILRSYGIPEEYFLLAQAIVAGRIRL